MAFSSQLHLVQCTIERGGFSSERSFEIPLADGSKAAGTANVRHFLTSERRPLDEDTPGYGETIDGFVKCRIVKSKEDHAVLIDVPSFDLVRVPQDALAEMISPE